MAQKIQLVDAKGTVRADFGLTENEPSIVFYNADQTNALIIGIQPDGNPGMSIMGKTKIIMGN